MNSSVPHRRSLSFGHLPFVGALAATLLLPLLAGCPGVLERPVGEYRRDGGTGGMTGSGGASGAPCDAPGMILQKDSKMGGCTGVICHNANSIPPFFSGVPAAGLKASLVAAAGKDTLDACKDQMFINTADPAASVIIKRVQGMECGEQMPSKLFDPTLSYLTPDQIACISSWMAGP